MNPAATICRDGRPTQTTTELSTALHDAAHTPGHFLWVDLDSPTRDEFTQVAEELALAGLDFDTLLRHRSRHSVDLVGDVYVLTFKALERIRKDDESSLTTTQVVLCVADSLVVSIHTGAQALFDEVRRHLSIQPDCLEVGPLAIAQVVCDEIVAEYDRIAHDIESEIIDVEHEVFDLHAPEPLDDIYALKREVLFFRRVEDPLHPVLTDLTRGRLGIPKEMAERFQQTLQDLDRVDNTIDSLNELITSILQAHLAQVAVQQNTDMRRISAWAAIIAVPTMIAGLYGMNFEYMPELHWTFAYPVALVVMVSSCFAVHRILKRAGWL